MRIVQAALLFLLLSSPALADQNIAKAMVLLRPNSQYAIRGNDCASLVWMDSNTTAPTCAEINAAIASLPPDPVLLPAITIIRRLTPDEYSAILAAAAQALNTGDGRLARWLDMARTAPGGVNLSDPDTIAAKQLLVSSGLLSQARADAVLSK